MYMLCDQRHTHSLKIDQLHGESNVRHIHNYFADPVHWVSFSKHKSSGEGCRFIPGCVSSSSVVKIDGSGISIPSTLLEVDNESERSTSSRSIRGASSSSLVTNIGLMSWSFSAIIASCCSKPSCSRTTGCSVIGWSAGRVSRNGTVRRWNAKCVFLWNVTKVQKFALSSWSV